jgi:CBS domain containing-hemolysin-like protein
VNIFATTLATILFTKWFGASDGPTLSTIVMTVVVLIFGEITPKTIARLNPDGFAFFAYPFLKLVITLLAPITFLFNLWQKFVGSFAKNSDNNAMSSEELITMIEEVEKEGSIKKEESELIQSAIEFSDVDIADIYTPRIDVVAVNLKTPKEEVAKVFVENMYSRIPVYKDSIDYIVGFIHYRDFFELKEEETIESIMQKPVYLPLTTRISDALKKFQAKKVHLGVVNDEFGGTAGIITLEDIIEELVGDIWDEHDEEEQDIIPLEENSYKIDGTVNIEEVFELFRMYEDDIYDSNTLSGWIIEINETIPKVGEIIYFKNLEIQILDADEIKIEWAKVSLAKEDESEDK